MHFAVATRKLGWLFGGVGIAYLASFFVLFDVTKVSRSPLYEFTESGKSPVVGPALSFMGCTLCKPRGPSFLWSTDYLGNEWLFVMYKPCILLWGIFRGDVEVVPSR